MKIELDLGASKIRWADTFSKPELFVFVYCSQDPSRKRIVPASEGQSVFFLENLPVGRAGDEFVVEVWDDDTLSNEERKSLSEALAAGVKLSAVTSGNITYLAHIACDDGKAIDVIADAAVKWEFSSWDFLGRAILRVGDNGLPTNSYANPVSIVTDDGREVIGKAFLYAQQPK